MVGRLLTVGVYGFTAERFLAVLGQAEVDVLFDVRQRRGVRGSEYAWANSRRLQHALSEHDIAYEHLKELAPTSEIRAAQYAADSAAGESKRTRTQLNDDFKRAYVVEDGWQVVYAEKKEDQHACAGHGVVCASGKST